MSENATPARFVVSRVTMVRVSGLVDDDVADELRRLLHDLVDGQGLTSVVVDLSRAGAVDGAGISEVLDASRRRLGQLGGTLELRLPVEIPEPVAELTTEIPSFTPIVDESLADGPSQN